MKALPRLVQRLTSDVRMARHRHGDAYAAIVLTGGYDEAGDSGRRHLLPGDVVIHAAFSAHADAIGRVGARVLNLPVSGFDEGFGRVHDADAIERLARRDPVAAAQQLRASWLPSAAEVRDWPDRLALDLLADPTRALASWAACHDLAAETVSRGFCKAFAVTPKRFRAELCARRALRAALATAQPLATIALDAGFADQAHMTHAITALTGHPPGYWRARSSRDKTVH
jgi:AraC-like DNA-binding protein